MLNRIRIIHYRTLLIVASCFLALAPSSANDAKVVTIAVASNFTAPLKAIIEEFEEQTSFETSMVVGATGQLYAQIINGAPFDIFLAADQKRPDLLIENGFAQKEDRMTYAIGQLVLYRAAGLPDKPLTGIRELAKHRIAIASPKLAPYGVAAISVLKELGVFEDVQHLIVEGKNISQAFQFVETGNTEIGLLSLSQMRGKSTMSYKVIPEDLYGAVRQDGVILEHGEGNKGARAFFRFLSSESAQKVIIDFGYRLHTP